jgi:hypothetical protein
MPVVSGVEESIGFGSREGWRAAFPASLFRGGQRGPLAGWQYNHRADSTPSALRENP